jgi:hypothetical protein
LAKCQLLIAKCLGGTCGQAGRQRFLSKAPFGAGGEAVSSITLEAGCLAPIDFIARLAMKAPDVHKINPAPRLRGPDIPEGREGRKLGSYYRSVGDEKVSMIRSGRAVFGRPFDTVRAGLHPFSGRRAGRPPLAFKV